MKFGSWVLAGAMLAGAAAAQPPSRPPAAPTVCADCVRATLQMLAGPDLHGRGCGTEDEHKAAQKLADLLKAAGVKGAVKDGGYLQEAPFTRRGQADPQKTYNVVGVLKGSAPDADKQAILLTAHYDHLGVRGGAIYPGADDDASGSAAVVEFARLLGKGKPPRRTVLFALFGCEEAGGYGARKYAAEPSLPLTDIAANLEFEMIGLPDPKHGKVLMLTGWERSNLGPALKDKGARIQKDPYPEQNFFARSDNYQLALKGVVAQTISAWPTPPTYHRPTDTIESLDFPFMVEVIQSLTAPIDWLVNSDFRPAWNEGMKP